MQGVDNGRKMLYNIENSGGVFVGDKELREKYNGHLPGNIYFDEDSEKIKMVFKYPKQIGIKKQKNDNMNMQTDENCFEGWAAALHVKESKKIALAVDFDFDYDKTDFLKDTLKNPHFGRFLYRALRFSGHYKWFTLEGKLKTAVEDFEAYLDSNFFTNNTPLPQRSKHGQESVNDNESGNMHGNENDPEQREKEVEKQFTYNKDDNDNYKMKMLLNLLKLNTDGKIYSQLPVGLFKDSAVDTNRITTGYSSAIDLWTISGNTFYPIELKAKNPMVGAITEIFFYSNFAYDLFVKSNEENSHFVLNYKYNKRTGELIQACKLRGYNEIVEKAKRKSEEESQDDFEKRRLNCVKGYLLLDEESKHPLVTKEILNELNIPGITYDIIEYNYDEIIN